MSNCSLPSPQNLDYNLVECQALVLAPTRELAQQIEKVRQFSEVKSWGCSCWGYCCCCRPPVFAVLAVWLLALRAARHKLRGSTAPAAAVGLLQ